MWGGAACEPPAGLAKGSHPGLQVGRGVTWALATHPAPREPGTATSGQRTEASTSPVRPGAARLPSALTPETLQVFRSLAVLPGPGPEFPSSLHVSRAPVMGTNSGADTWGYDGEDDRSRPSWDVSAAGEMCRAGPGCPSFQPVLWSRPCSRQEQECPLRSHLPEGETEGAPKGSRILARPLSRSHPLRLRVSGTSNLALPFSDGNTEDRILESLRLSLPEPSQ